MDEDDETWMDYLRLIGCICEHDSDKHDWNGCLFVGCGCEGSWEE